MKRIATRIGALVVMACACGTAHADKVVIKDAKSGEVLATAEIGGKAVKIGKRSVKIEKAKPPAASVKANSIMVSLDFEEATLEEGIEFLRRKAQEFDNTEKDPAKRGLNFIVFGDKNFQPPSITLRLNHVDLHTALKYICEICKLELDYTDQAVELRPRK